jgi:hypothetical protein
MEGLDVTPRTRAINETPTGFQQCPTRSELSHRPGASELGH